MTSDAETKYTIYLDSSNKDKILNNSNTYEKYVILQNETLHIKVNELQNKVNNLESSIEDLEDDNDRMEKSKVYTKNLLKNFAELDKLNIKWREESTKHYKEINTKHIKVIESINLSFMLFHFVFIICLAIYLHNMRSIDIIFRLGIYGIFLYLSIMFCIYISEHIKFNLIEKTDKVKTIKEDIKKINDCYDFIHEYIDNV